MRTGDILRAATVFLHATLEDFLRAIEVWKLPKASESVLNEVPLVGLGARAEKFLLGRLAKYRDKRVDELIQESVSAYLSSVTYNSTDDISAMLRRIGLNVSRLNRHFSDLNALMKRRHDIVHRADRIDGRGSGFHGARSISKSDVKTWIDIVGDFKKRVMRELKHRSSRQVKKLLTSSLTVWARRQAAEREL